DSIYCIGSIGLLGTRPAQEALEECDTLLMVGTSFPYIEFYPKPGQARAIQIDIDSERIGLRYPVQCGLVGDSKGTLQKLISLVHTHKDKRFLEKAQDGMQRWWHLMKEQGCRMDKPMKPQVVAWELGKQLSSNAIVSCDSGTVATWWARQIPVKRGQMYSLSGNLATMGCGLPYAIAAQLAYPDRQCIAFVGDGAFSMLMADFSTCVKYKIPVKIIIIKNNSLGQIKWEQMVFLGNPEYGVDLEPINFANFARDCGGLGYTIEDPHDCEPTLREALSQPGPVIIEAVVDPFEPPMPAKITPDQAFKFAESLIRGEPNRQAIALTVLEDKVKELI
ncbi:MAG: thiamine pyrophosphate-dependent enzyme, partial [Bdellovibrionia bacterium]